MTMKTVKRFTFLILLLILTVSSALEAYYDPHIGRFTQRDPAGDGINWYAYAANNPMKFVDPTGTTIVLLGPADGAGNSISEIVMNAEGTHGGARSAEVAILYKAIMGARTINNTQNPSLRDTAAMGE